VLNKSIMETELLIRKEIMKLDVQL